LEIKVRLQIGFSHLWIKIMTNFETNAESAYIEFRNVGKRFGSQDNGFIVLEDINIGIKRNEFVSIVGRSGCGKTTLLNIAAGLVAASSGETVIAGKKVDGPGQGQGVVFQQHALFPWLTAAGNIEFGCRSSNLSKAEKKQLVQQLLELIGLAHAANSYPRELSGGMQQRVAIARALAMDPEILVMDEPFGALDELTRIELQDELLRIWEVKKKTVLFVTHSINEALVLSDRIIVLAPHPLGVHMDIEVTLPRPRDRTTPQFNALYKQIWEGLSS
tara:strand:+ start:101928 stop:102752 length:825 start_codon:yes stop_codon:yes gene_type:complete